MTNVRALGLALALSFASGGCAASQPGGSATSCADYWSHEPRPDCEHAPGEVRSRVWLEERGLPAVVHHDAAEHCSVATLAMRTDRSAIDVTLESVGIYAAVGSPPRELPHVRRGDVEREVDMVGYSVIDGTNYVGWTARVRAGDVDAITAARGELVVSVGSTIVTLPERAVDLALARTECEASAPAGLGALDPDARTERCFAQLDGLRCADGSACSSGCEDGRGCTPPDDCVGR